MQCGNIRSIAGRSWGPWRRSYSRRWARVRRHWCSSRLHRPQRDVPLGRPDGVESRPPPQLPTASRWASRSGHTSKSGPCRSTGVTSSRPSSRRLASNGQFRLCVSPPSSPKLNGQVERATGPHAEQKYAVADLPWTVEELIQHALAWERVCNTVRPSLQAVDLLSLPTLRSWPGASPLRTLLSVSQCVLEHNTSFPARPPAIYLSRCETSTTPAAQPL